MGESLVEPVVVEGDGERPSAHAHGKKRRLLSENSLKLLSLLILILGLLVISYPFVRQYLSGVEQSRLSDESTKKVQAWPYPQAEESIKAAKSYNARLAQSGQPVMGEVVDPFGSEKTHSQTESEKDKQYQQLLDQGEGQMGSVRIPKISVNLSIYHGTSEAALASGAGHLYGTSLPVGGPSTHSVITGHRGLVNALMFTRLDEMKVGDPFYITSMGKTNAYEVDRIKVIEPDDTSSLRIQKGEDRVTLMTCTPYGVNTHRLLVSGIRARMPEPIPYPQDAKKDLTLVAVLTMAFLVLTLLVSLFIIDNRKVWAVRHAAKRGNK
ncbi:class C sortase [Bifidobacterium aemilianum]|uniref:Class C sortase n=1 Tax=Bifidobacterium aemilianum TaxID=2493120 RepID=A0A366K886_9BIFI|nr:class C sortase [Bifidobacterium aemilianum]RBP97462.1 class C sortase [Bifidobacterium aemilianum]